MLGLRLRQEFKDRRLKGTAIELANTSNTGATQLRAQDFLEITYSHDGNQRLSIAPGDTATTLSVDLVNDDVHEGDEDFEIEIYEVSGATAGRDRATITIKVDPDFPDEPEFRVDPTTIEVSEATGTVSIDIVHDSFRTQDNPITIAFETQDGTATEPGDYTERTGTLIFPAGRTVTRTIEIEIANDAVAESTESFTLHMGTPSTGAFDAGGAVATITIRGNDAADATGAPAISGTAQVGALLSASAAGITDPHGTTKAQAGDPGYAWAWQWIRVDGTTETAISSENSQTYRLTASDEGMKVKVEVRFLDDDGNSEGPKASPAWPAGTDTIAPGSANASPQFTGGTSQTRILAETIGDATIAAQANIGEPKVLKRRLARRLELRGRIGTNTYRAGAARTAATTANREPLLPVPAPGGLDEKVQTKFVVVLARCADTVDKRGRKLRFRHGHLRDPQREFAPGGAVCERSEDNSKLWSC